MTYYNINTSKLCRFELEWSNIEITSVFLPLVNLSMSPDCVCVHGDMISVYMLNTQSQLQSMANL